MMMMLCLRAFCIPDKSTILRCTLPHICHAKIKLSPARPPIDQIRNPKKCRNPGKIASSQVVCFKDGDLAPDDSPISREKTSSIAPESTSISCTTFNILAPIYKRINGEDCRESQFPESWIGRNQRIVDLLLLKNSSIICLQEFWLGNEELVRLYETNLHDSGYQTYKLARTNDRGDGLLTAIKSERLRVLQFKELQFNDCGDRVAQLFHIQTKPSFFQTNPNANLEILLVNTHLLFPHDFNYCVIRLRQVYKILECLDQFKSEHGLTSIPVVLCGDWNGSKRGRVYKFLRSQGYLSSYDTAHAYTDSDFRRWISHRNHRGNTCEVDFVWLLNPDTRQKPLSASWTEAMLGTIKAKLCEIGLTGRDAFSFFQSRSDSDVLTLEDFQQGLGQLGLTDEAGLTSLEIKQVMQMIDADGNGVIDNSEFKETIATSRATVSDLSTMEEGLEDAEDFKLKNVDGLKVLSIKDASFFPPEAEDGVWPEAYSLSDHAALTVTFTHNKVSVTCDKVL